MERSIGRRPNSNPRTVSSVMLSYCSWSKVPGAARTPLSLLLTRVWICLLPETYRFSFGLTHEATTTLLIGSIMADDSEVRKSPTKVCYVPICSVWPCHFTILSLKCGHKNTFSRLSVTDEVSDHLKSRSWSPLHGWNVQSRTLHTPLRIQYIIFASWAEHCKFCTTKCTLQYDKSTWATYTVALRSLDVNCTNMDIHFTSRKQRLTIQ